MNEVIIAREFKTKNELQNWQIKLAKDVIRNVLYEDTELSENMDILDELINKDESELLHWLLINDEPEYILMTKHAKFVFNVINNYLDYEGYFISTERVIDEVIDRLG